jgi:hypothetical protein
MIENLCHDGCKFYFENSDLKTNALPQTQISDALVDRVISETVDLLESKGYLCKISKSCFFGDTFLTIGL